MFSPATALCTVDIVAAPFAYGANEPGCARAPEALRAAGLGRHLAIVGAPADWRALSAPPQRDRLAGAAAACTVVAREVEASVRACHRLLVLGGDHSIAAGTWAGAARALRARGPIGLIWIDAHLDAHVPETSPSGNIHGMPLACLLGAGPPELTGFAGFTPALDPHHVVVIGARSFEVEEAAFLARKGVKVFGMADVAENGLPDLVARATGIASSGTAGFGISLDVDALDPREAPAVGTPVPGGIDALDLMQGLLGIADVPGYLGIEIVEYNPDRDPDHRTGDVVSEVALAALATGARR